MNDATLLAMLLREGPESNGSYPLSESLLRQFGSLKAVMQAPRPLLLSVPGVGRARADLVRATPAIARRYFESTMPVGEAIRSPADTACFLQARIGHLAYESFCCLYLDNRHRVLRFDELFRGTIDGTSVYPREIVKEALAVNAAALIVAHNHPSGVAEPSQADERITRRLKAALELVDIRLLDHLVVGDATTTSLASRGLL
jgi:DNA repair protein RadC